MWIENRGRNEAVPVVIQDAVPVIVQNVATTVPMPVRLAGNVPGAPPPPVAVRNAVQAWEYQTISIPQDAAAQDLTSLLTSPGNAGWEPSGIQLAHDTTTLLVMKRPRS